MTEDGTRIIARRFSCYSLEDCVRSILQATSSWRSCEELTEDSAESPIGGSETLHRGRLKVWRAADAFTFALEPYRLIFCFFGTKHPTSYR